MKTLGLMIPTIRKQLNLSKILILFDKTDLNLPF